MTIMQSSFTCLCAALLLCFGTLPAQQPTQQRFLRFLGQRSVTTGTLLPTVESIRCGLPSTSPLVFAMTDAEGKIIRDDSSIVTLSLVEQFIPTVSDTNILDKYYTIADKCVSEIDWCSFTRIECQMGTISRRFSSGIVEYDGVTIYGKVKPFLTLVCSSANVQATTVSVSLIGGGPLGVFFEKTKSGKLAVPGIASGGTPGFIPYIEVGKKVVLNNPDSSDLNHISIKITDSWGNYTSFATSIWLRFYDINRGLVSPYNGDVMALGNNVLSDPATGLAVFKDLVIYSATSGNVILSPSFDPPWYLSYPIERKTQATLTESFSSKHGSQLTCSRGWTSATFSLVPGPAVSITPIDNSSPLSGWRGYERLRTFPRIFEIGKSNASDTSRWFYLQAVDKFGNRVDTGPNAYNGGTATIHFATPEEGLPRSTTSSFQFSASNDPFVRVNSQHFAATGTSAVAVNGLYTFNNFMPLGVASMGTTDTVVLTFEDPALKGVNSPFPLVPWLFRPIPPITTATTTFVRTTDVRLHEEASGLSATPNPTSDALYINCSLPVSAPVIVRIEDMLGRILLRYEEQTAAGGTFTTTLDVSRLPQGAYTLHVQSGRERWTRRVVILR